MGFPERFKQGTPIYHIMRFEVKNRDGPARIGELLIKDRKITTPNILFVNTSRFKAPNFADILLTNNNIKTERSTLRIGDDAFSSLASEVNGELSINNYLIYPKDVSKKLHLFAIKFNKKQMSNCYVMPSKKETINDALKDSNSSLFIVANAAQLLSQQSKFVEFITELREKIGYQKMIYLPCIGNPTNLALLTYLGIDFFDSMSAIIAARNNILLFPTGKYDKNKLNEIACNCPACNKINDKPSEMSYSQILNHNYFAFINEIKQVRNAISQGNLRELVEIRVRASPELTAILKNLDYSHYNFLEERTPITRKSQLIATTKEALFRPEIKRFQERIIKRYRKPEGAKILLLLPCSAKKPYSFSKSHKLFRERIFNLKNPHVIHEVIITSPLGIVPRDIELIYPASSYDIPVTGHWDEDEKKIIRTLLQLYLESNKYDKIIMHLPTDIQEFINDIIKNPLLTCIDKPTSNDSLEKLFDTLKKSVEPYEKVTTAIRSKEDLESLASFQFGRRAAKKLLKDCQIKGKYPYKKIIYEKNQIGMTTKERGLISLTITGAKRLKESTKYWVEIYDDFILKGSLFAPGITDADMSIRIGDEVIVLKNHKICAVGVAQMNGKEMKESSRGESVKIRHYC